MNRQKLVIIDEASDFHIVEVHAHLPAAVARGALSPRRVNEDVPHGFSGGSKEVCAPGKSARLAPG